MRGPLVTIMCAVTLGQAALVRPALASSDQEAKMTECTKTVRPGQDLGAVLSTAPDGAVVCLAPGRYAGGLRVERSVTLRGEGEPGEVVIDADDAARVLTVVAKGAKVLVESVTLTGGSADAGGAVTTETFAELVLRRCVLRGNRSRDFGGGAVYASRGHIVLERCRLVDNTARQGIAVLASQVARIEVRDSLVISTDPKGAALAAGDGAELTIERSTIVCAGPALSAAGTTSRAPKVAITDSIVSGRPLLTNSPRLPATVVITRTLLHGEAAGFEDGGGNKTGDPMLDSHTYKPTEGSPAGGMARGGVADLDGAPRPEVGATAGALER